MALFNTSDTVKMNNPLAQDHIGVVIDVEDTENLCRVRVIIPGLLDENNQVWFTRITQNFPGVTYATPRIGQRIRVWFRDNTLTSGVYGLDYVHTATGLSYFQPGDYGFADINSNVWRVRNNTTYYQTGSMTLDTNCLNVTGKIFSGSGWTGTFSDSSGRLVNVVGGIITGVSED